MHAALPLHPTLTHPLTGQPLRAVFVSKTGRVYWPVMGGAPDDPPPSDPPAGPPPSDPPPADPPADPPSGDPAQKVEDLPEWAQKQIRDARAEAGNHRTAKNAAEQKQAETLDAIAKALGLKKDETPDPVKLAEQLTTAQTAVKDTAVELAVYRTAGKNGGDPDALLDSRAFMTKVRDLDHTAKDFATKLADEIKDAVKDNPKLKTGQAPGSSSVDHAGGPGERRSDKPKSLADAVSASYGT